MSHVILTRPSKTEKNTDSHLNGSITVTDAQKIMFTIPYDEGWTLTVDGKETKLKKVLGAFMAADADPGEHTYEMTFMPSGLKTGTLAAGASLLLIVCYILLDSRRRRKLVDASSAKEGLSEEINDSKDKKSEADTDPVKDSAIDNLNENVEENSKNEL